MHLLENVKCLNKNICDLTFRRQTCKNTYKGVSRAQLHRRAIQFVKAILVETTTLYETLMGYFLFFLFFSLWLLMLRMSKYNSYYIRIHRHYKYRT